MAFRDDYQVLQKAISEGQLPETKKFMTLVEKAEQEPNDKAIADLKKEYVKIEKKWRKEHDNDETFEMYLNTLWRKIAIIEQELNQQLHDKRTKWDIFQETARSNKWTEVVKLIEEFETIDDNNYRKIEPDYFHSLEEQYQSKVIPYILEHLTKTQQREVDREIQKRFRVYRNRIERRVEKDFGAWLRQVRKARKLSLKELEDMSGVTASYIHRIETGSRKTPSIPIAEKLAKGLNIDPQELFAMLNNQDGPVQDAQKVNGFTELIALNKFTIKDKDVTKEQKDQLLKIFNKIVDEEWKLEDAWSKGSELLQMVSNFKKSIQQ